MDDYFAGSRGSAPPPQPASPQATPFTPPPVWQQPPTATAPAQAWPPQWSAPPSPGRSPATTALIVVASVVGAIVVMGVLAAIAIPVFLNEREKAEAARTVVSIPPVAAGLALRTDAVGDGYAQRLRDIRTPGTHLAGAYGGAAGRPEAVVSVTRLRMSFADQRDYLDAAVRSAVRASAAGAAAFGDIAPGPLGGRVTCSSATTMTICFFADAGAYGSVVVWADPARAMDLVPQLRAAVEQRRA